MFPFRLNDDILLELLDLRHADELFRLTDANRAHLRQWLPWVSAVPERPGFACESTVRQTEWLYDHFVDHAVYGTLASEWPGKRAD